MNTFSEEVRNRKIIRAGTVILVVELLMFSVKYIAGQKMDSIAVTSDAINNLTDALYALITIITTALAGKSPDRSHPFGYGRIEYLSVLGISILGLYLGLNMAGNVIYSCLHPQTPEYDLNSFLVILAAMAVKIFLCPYMLIRGEQTQSAALSGFGVDAVLDILLSLGTVISAIVYVRFGLDLEIWVSIIISFFVIRTAAVTLKDTAEALVGQRPDRQFLHDLKRTIMTVDGVLGIHDVYMHNYGKMREFGAIHISVPGNITARRVDEISREIQHLVLETYGFPIRCIGIFTSYGGTEACTRLEDEIRGFLRSYDDVLQVHGLMVDMERKEINADVVIDYAALGRQKTYDDIEERLTEKYPEYRIYISRDAS